MKYSPWMKVVVFVLFLIPFFLQIHQVYLAQTGGIHNLGSEPGKTLVDRFGEYALYILWLTLLITPLRRWFKLNVLMKFRRMVGLFVFFYSAVHLLSYGTFLLQWDFAALGDDLKERPYIFVGFAAFVGLLVLTITSPKFMVRKLKKNWAKIHQSVYLIAILVLVHELMQARASLAEFVVHASLFALVLLPRLKWKLDKVRSRAKTVS